jgi:hypothetical protein
MEANMAIKDREYALADSIEKLTGILTGMAGELEDLAESFGVSGEELAELNDGKTQEEIEQEDALAMQIAAPLVNALDGISGILNKATTKIMETAAEQYNGETKKG